MGPLNSSGEFMWIASSTGHRTPCLCAEGALSTNLQPKENANAA